MEVKNFDKLVNAVALNILKQFDVGTTKKISKQSCLILLPNIGIGLTEYFTYISEQYKDYELYLSAHSELSSVEPINKSTIEFVSFDVTNKNFIHLVNHVETIIVLGLKINQLRDISNTNDQEEIAGLILESIMANKSIHIVMNANGLLFHKITDVIQGIRDLGIDVTNIQQLTGESHDDVELITEQYVVALKNHGLSSLVLNKKQLITPLAKDKLREYNITVKYNEEDKL